MTCGESHWLQKVIQENDVLSRISFVVSRAESVEDPAVLARTLFDAPLSLVHDLFSRVVAAAMPETLAALKRVAAQNAGDGEPPSPFEPSVEEMFSEDTIGG